MSEMRMVSLPDMHLVVRLNPDDVTCDLVKAFRGETLAREFVTQNAQYNGMGLSEREKGVLALLKQTNTYMQNKELVVELETNRTVVMRDLDRLLELGFIQTVKKGKHRFYFVEGAKEKSEIKRAPVLKTAPPILPETQAPKPVNEGMERPQSTQDLIDHFMKNGGQVRRVERGASGDFYNVRMWLESIGLDIKQMGARKDYKVNGKKLTKDQVFELYDEERKNRGLEPLRVGGANV